LTIIKSFSIFKQEGVRSEGCKSNIPSFIALLEKLAPIFLFLYAVAIINKQREEKSMFLCYSFVNKKPNSHK